ITEPACGCRQSGRATKLWSTVSLPLVSILKTVPRVPVPPCAVVPYRFPDWSMMTPPIGVRPSGRDVNVWSTVSVCACADTTAAKTAASSNTIRRGQNEEQIDGSMDNSFLFPSYIDCGVAGPDEAKNPAGERASA